MWSPQGGARAGGRLARAYFSASERHCGPDGPAEIRRATRGPAREPGRPGGAAKRR